MPRSKKIAKNSHLSWPDIRYLIFLIIWVIIAMTFSQIVIALPLQLILGDQFSQPLYTCLFYGLTYVLALILIIIVPPKAAQYFRKTPENLQTSRADSRRNRAKKTISFSSEMTPENLTTSLAELGLNNFPSVIDVLLAPVAYFVYLVIAQIFTNFMSIFAWFNPEEAQNVGFGYFITTDDRIIAMIALVFIAPIAEEIIMRGWLYGKLRTKLKIPLAIILTSLVFSLLHGQWNVSVGVFALSLVLCSLREITGTIWSGILLHMLSNGIAFYLLYIAL